MNNNFCPAPWISVYVDPAGTIENCCVSKNRLGNIHDIKVMTDSLTKGKNLQIQKDMLAGNSVPGCSWCHNRTHTLQSRFLELFPKSSIESFRQTSHFELQYLDVRWSNTCNYACVYCSPTLSSAWATELGEKHRIESSTKTQLLSYVLDNIEKLKHIYMAGGEPTMMKENEIILEELLLRNPQCRVIINTNLSRAQGSRVFDLSTRLPHCGYMVSVEDREERYEYIRYPGKWQTFNENLNTLQAMVLPQAIAFNMVFLNINALTIWDTIDDLLDRNFERSGITLALYNNGTMDGPWNMAHTPLKYRQAVLQRMERDRYRSIIGWQNIREYIESLPENTDSDSLCSELSRLDLRRGLDSRKTFDLVYKYLDLQ